MKYLLSVMLICLAGCNHGPSEADLQRFRTYQDAKYQLLDKESALTRAISSQKMLEESSKEYQALSDSIAANKLEIQRLKVIVDEYESNMAKATK